MARSPQPTPNWTPAATTYLPACEPTADTIVREIVEGRARPSCRGRAAR